MMKIVVSLTTYPARIGTVNQVVESIMRQSLPPDQIVLWLSRIYWKDDDVLVVGLR